MFIFMRAMEMIFIFMAILCIRTHIKCLYVVYTYTARYLIAWIRGDINCMPSSTASTPIIGIHIIGFVSGIAAGDAVASCRCCCTADF